MMSNFAAGTLLQPEGAQDEIPARRLRRVGVLGTGRAVPEGVVTNRDLEGLVHTSDEWIVTRTGMRERRRVATGTATSDLASEAGRGALDAAGLDAADVELILVATTTPDTPCPPTACHVQRKIGARRAAGFDVGAACTGFVNALMAGHGLVASGAYGNALVIGADTLSTITDYQDRESCILFGDGAGAILLGADAPRGEMLDHVVGIDGEGHHLIQVPAGGSQRPASRDTVDARQHYLSLRGREVFRFAVAKFVDVVAELVRRLGVAVTDIDVFVPHQANLRILEAAAARLRVPMDRMVINIDRYGNTAAASVPMAFDEALREGRIRRGDLVCQVAFGGGLSWGGTMLRW